MAKARGAGVQAGRKGRALRLDERTAICAGPARSPVPARITAQHWSVILQTGAFWGILASLPLKGQLCAVEHASGICGLHWFL